MTHNRSFEGQFLKGYIAQPTLSVKIYRINLMKIGSETDSEKKTVT